MKKIYLLSIFFLFLLSCETHEVIDPNECKFYKNDISITTLCEINEVCCPQYGCVDFEDNEFNLGSCSSCADNYANCDGDIENGCEQKLVDLFIHSCGECISNYANCDNDWKNGCETNLFNSNLAACHSCLPQFGNCDNNWENGCETNLTNKNLNECTACIPEYGNCNNDWEDGCESSFQEKNLQDCGSCKEGYIDKDDNLSNGCEKACESKTDCKANEICDNGFCVCEPEVSILLNSGACVSKASINFKNGPFSKTADCTNEDCVCLDNYKNCDGSWNNGCEINISNDLENCGECNKLCSHANAVSVCENKTCSIQNCNATYYNCDDNIINGCETIACGIFIGNPCDSPCSAPNVSKYVCEAIPCNTPPCISIGQCAIDTCALGYLDCDKDYKTGCEISSFSDNKNCGACARVCPERETCMFGRCHDFSIVIPVPLKRYIEF